MNWEVAGAIGEIVDAFAVVVSLVYLAIQIRNQNVEAKAATVQEVLRTNADTISQLQDPDLARIWITGLNDVSKLSNVDRRTSTVRHLHNNNLAHLRERVH